MAYGLRVWDSIGTLILDTTDKLARLVYTTTQDGTTSGSVNVAEADGKTAIVVAYQTSGSTGSVMACKIGSDGTLSWEHKAAYYGIPATGPTTMDVYVLD